MSGRRRGVGLPPVVGRRWGLSVGIWSPRGLRERWADDGPPVECLAGDGRPPAFGRWASVPCRTAMGRGAPLRFSSLRRTSPPRCSSRASRPPPPGALSLPAPFAPLFPAPRQPTPALLSCRFFPPARPLLPCRRLCRVGPQRGGVHRSGCRGARFSAKITRSGRPFPRGAFTACQYSANLAGRAVWYNLCSSEGRNAPVEAGRETE